MEKGNGAYAPLMYSHRYAFSLDMLNFEIFRILSKNNRLPQGHQLLIHENFVSTAEELAASHWEGDIRA